MKLLSGLKERFLNLSIMGKLLALMLVGSVCPILLIAAYSYTSAREQILQQAYENRNQMNRQINIAISHQLDGFWQISEMLYANATLKAYLTQNYQRDMDFVEAYDYINDLFGGLMAANDSVAEITVYIPNATLPSDGVFVKHLSDEAATPEWVRQMDGTHRNIIYTGVYENASGERVISLGRSLDFTSVSFPRGVLALSMREEELYSLIGQGSEKELIYVVDEEGGILSAKNKELLSRSLAELIGVELPQEKEGRLFLEVEGEQCLVVYNRMEQGWRTVALIPLEDILKETREGVRNILGIAGVSLLLSLGMVLFISGYLNGRIRSLTAQTARIEAGDFKGRIQIRGNDEIEQLSRAVNNMTERLEGLVQELYHKELSRRDAELYALQSQINPHFLYNTLSAIASLAIRRGDEQISALIDHLSSFYRISLNKGMKYISIQNELEITRHYIAVQDMRFGDQFQESYELDGKLYPYKTMKLILQPFVENAVNHAMGTGERVLHVLIRLYRRGDAICFEVEDDGPGMCEEKLQQLNAGRPEAGFGIRSVDERIRLAYGEDFGVRIESAPKKGTKAVVTIPV